MVVGAHVRNCHVITTANRVRRAIFVVFVLAGLLPPGVISAAPAATLSPTSGPPGTGVTVTGSGWTPNNSRLYIAFNTVWLLDPIQTRSDSAGNFSASFVVPQNAPIGPSPVWVHEGWLTANRVTLSFTVTASMQPPSGGCAPWWNHPIGPSHICLDPNWGPPGTSVNVQGSFGAVAPPSCLGSRVEAFWDGQQSVAQGTTATGNGFSLSFTVPRGAQGGAHNVIFRFSQQGQCGGPATTSLTATFTVTGSVLPPPPPQPLILFVSVDRGPASTYVVGDPISICVTVSRWVHVRFTNRLPDGQVRNLNDGLLAEGIHCLDATTGPPFGQRLVRAEAMEGGQVIASDETTFVVVDGQAPPPPPPVRPGGLWIEPADGQNVSGLLHFGARAYPTEPEDPGIERVEFTAWWPALGPESGQWKVACRLGAPSRGDIYECNWDLAAGGVPPGQVRVSFDVYDRAGNRNLSPHGTRTIIYAPVTPEPRVLQVVAENDPRILVTGYVDDGNPHSAELRIATDWYMTLQILPDWHALDAMEPNNSVYAAIGFLGPNSEARYFVVFEGEDSWLDLRIEATREAVMFHLLQLLADVAGGIPGGGTLVEFALAGTDLDRADRIARITGAVYEMEHLAAAVDAIFDRDDETFVQELIASWLFERDSWDDIGGAILGEIWSDVTSILTFNLLEIIPEFGDMINVWLLTDARDRVRFVVRPVQ